MSRRALTFLALLLSGCARSSPDAARAERVRLLKLRQDQLWGQFENKISSEAPLQEILEEESEALVVIQSELLTTLIEKVAARYLDRVELDLPLRAQVRAGGDVRVKGKFGIREIHAGSWELQLTIQRLRGVLAAKTPSVAIEAENRIALRLPVVLQQARGRAHLRFTWNSRGLANMVCRDFTIERDVEATAEPGLETLSGALTLEARGDTLRAVPSFKDVPYTVRPVPTPESWKTLQAALAEQDTFMKCGIAIDPAVILPKLRERLGVGFPVHLPKKLFRPFALPASLRSALERDGRQIELSVSPATLRFAHRALWYGARISAERPPTAVKTP